MSSFHRLRVSVLQKSTSERTFACRRCTCSNTIGNVRKQADTATVEKTMAMKAMHFIDEKPVV